MKVDISKILEILNAIMGLLKALISAKDNKEGTVSL